MPLPPIDPPLINSASPWATTIEDLQKLFDCPHTGAVTLRTSLLHAFEHDANVHQYSFFDPSQHVSQPANIKGEHVPPTFSGSMNTLGYSPIPLARYLSMLGTIMADSRLPDSARRQKPFVISVTGSAEEVVECYRKTRAQQAIMPNPLCMEINLSCPNIPGKPPPAYSAASLIEYLQALASEIPGAGREKVAIGIKTPPYTYHDQFQGLMDALKAVNGLVVDFITATNTLGSSLLLDVQGVPVLKSASGAGTGGMAGAPLHPLALGNVREIRHRLDQLGFQHIDVIGVGGVGDRQSYDRMRAVGASVVGVGTALGKEGVDVFSKILEYQ